MNDTAWADFLQVRVELGTGETFDPTLGTTWGAAHWGTDAHWAGREPLWVDVTCHFRSVEIDGGVDYTVGRFTTGTAQLVAENASGWAGLLLERELDIRVRRAIRVLAVVTAPGISQGLQVPLFRGYLDGITPIYLAGGRPGVQFDCVDALALFAADDPLELDPPVGAGELSGARVNRILDRAGWAPTWRDIDAGQVTVQATNLARPYADELGVTADTEGGALFIGPAGDVIFRDRDWLRTGAGHTFTIGNTVAGDACPTAWITGQSMGELVSQVALANAGGTVRNYRDGVTFSQIGPATYRRFDLIATDPAQLDILAGRILAVRGYVTARVRGTTLSLLGDPRWASTMLGALRYGTRILAVYEDPAGADSFSFATVVTRISHRIDADGDWLLTLGLEDAAPYAPAQPWGAARWGMDNWTSAGLDVAQELETIAAAVGDLARDLEAVR